MYVRVYIYIHVFRSFSSLLTYDLPCSVIYIVIPLFIYLLIYLCIYSRDEIIHSMLYIYVCVCRYAYVYVSAS